MGYDTHLGKREVTLAALMMSVTLRLMQGGVLVMYKKADLMMSVTLALSLTLSQSLTQL